MRSSCALVYVLLACLTAGVGSAQAEEFGSLGSGPGQFIEPNGMAIDQGNGDVYVVDTNNERVDKFTKMGRFLLAWGWGVIDGRTAALQTCTASSGCSAGLRGEGPGQFGFTEGVAVDNSTLSSSRGDVYVVDISHHRVEKFGPSGRFMLMFGRGVNKTARARGEVAREDICRARAGDQCQAGVAGTASGQFEFSVEGNFIAVGPYGRVYVGDRNCVQEFAPDGKYLYQVALRPPPARQGLEMGGTSRLAVDSAGNLYAVRLGVSGVLKYSPQGELLQAFALDEPQEDESPTPGIALDPEGHVFLDYRSRYGEHRLLEYDRSGKQLAVFDTGMEDGLHGIAYGDIAHKLYVLNAGNPLKPKIGRVRIVTPPRTPPPLSTVLSGFGAPIGL